MPTPRIGALWSVPLMTILVGCGGGEDAPGASTTGGASPSSGVHDTCGGGVESTGCDQIVAPGATDTEHLQTALIEAKSGSSVCLCPGTWHVDKQLSLTVPNVTVRGLGKAITDTSLDFSGVAAGGNDTMLVTADGFTIENLWVRNTPGNGVVVRQSDRPTFRKLKVDWDGGPKATNGAYAVYPAECTNVLIEDCEVEGAADAAIYVGQGTGAIVRRNKAHGSVLGIELENTTSGEVYDNEAWDNSSGLAVFLLGNLNKKTSEKVLVHDNLVHDNNHDNFGDAKTFVASVPTGTGVIVVGGHEVEIRDNRIEHNDGAGVLVVSYELMSVLVPGAKKDPGIDPNPTDVFVHGNTFVDDGAKPHPPLTLLGLTTLEQVMWDGITKSGDPASNDAKICLGAKGPYPSFRMFAGEHIGDASKQSTDTGPYECVLPTLPALPDP